LKKRNGFTLIELLVVIAIIAILAAILFPVFIKAKATAKTTECLSRLKDMGSAYALYTDAWDSTMPSGVNGPLNGLIRQPIIDQLKPYLKTSKTHYGYVQADPKAQKTDTGIPEVFFCPSFNEEWRKAHPWYMNAGTYNLEYCDAIADDQYPAKKIPECIAIWNRRIAEQKISTRVAPRPGPSGAQLAECFFGDQFREPRVSYPHSGGTNVLFLDFHVKYYRPPSARNE